MIYTLTVNPCLDYYITTCHELCAGATNRADSADIKAGGKGVNVSLALKKIGENDVKTVVALGGKNGERILRELSDKGLDCTAFEACGESRINVKINSCGVETEINAKGSAILQSVRNDIISYFSAVGENDVIVLAGSLPDKCPDDFYADIILAAHCKNIAVDCTKNTLRKALDRGVWVAKPNIDELCEFFETDISWQQIPFYAGRLCEMGAQYALVSAGAKGAVLASKDKILRANAPSGCAVCSTGAGDTMLAAFVYSLKIRKSDVESALKFAVAAGSAKAFCEGFAEINQIEKLCQRICVEEVF